jgi:Pyruvate-formate lyase
VQSVQFVTFCVSLKPLRAGGILQYQLGRPDRYLSDYYYNDIKSGVITQYEAQTLLDCLGVLINRRVPHGLSSGYMVGGRNADGVITKGELTQMCMKVVSDNRLVYPSVGLCVADSGNEQIEDIKIACEILGKGCSHPAFFNDDVIQQGLRNYDLPADEACSYIHSTCVEITPIASSNVWVASPYINLVQTLLDVLNKEYTSKSELLEAYFNNLANRIHNGYKNEVKNRIERKRYDMDPLLSCFVNDCLRNGIDIEHGGAKYNWIMPSFVGLSNAADSINAINELIFDKQLYTFGQLKEMLDNNFSGYENERQIFSQRVEKYGNDNDEIDSIVKTITERIAEFCRKYNGLIIPSLFCWIMHDIFGRETGASPDGRLAGLPLGDGSGPAQGREHEGPTASILSSTKWDHTPFIGGIAVNMKFSKSYMSGESYDVMTALIKSYLTRGGFELQINVTDAELLKEAQKHPELYRDLVVRIGGYSDYFVSLSSTMQEEVITRTTYCI